MRATEEGVTPEGRAPSYGKGVVQKGIWGIPKLKFTNFKILPRISPIPRKEEGTLSSLFLYYMSCDCSKSPASYY